MQPTLLIDGNNVLVRAVEATRRVAMNSPTGVDTSALVSTVATISRHIREEKPGRVVVLWDGGADGWRKKIYPQYKANRPQATDTYRSHSRALVREFFDLAGIPQQIQADYEADDLIAAHWRASDEPLIILSNDKDMLQLAGYTPRGQACGQIRLSSSDTPTDRWNADRVTEHFGCTPEQLPLVLALAGDPSDNVPGVPGIGPKFAVKHLAAARWDLDAVTHQGIREHMADVAVYRELVDLRNNGMQPRVPRIPLFLPFVQGPDPAWRNLHAFCERHGLRQIAAKLSVGHLW
ncbi:5'-3' exonuclease H3TH domain-containing protein [Streptomyces sp. NPDC056454]|uniref:5'-3' exonuclease n=1 Tax=Streptomyces sp. NPDC056454 TaxID=3345823 RepID=UPI0036B31D60